MTSSSPAPAPVHDPHRRGGGPPSGELDPAAVTWYLAGCAFCGDDLAEPFRDPIDRDRWAIDHLLGTSHTVGLSIADTHADWHGSAYLRRTDDGDGFKWLCMAAACAVRWVGPYDTPQLALAGWRGHEGVTR